MKAKNFMGLALVAMLLLVFNSCKKDTVDVTDLLKSVPSSAGGVVVIDTEGILEDTGSKVKGHEIVPSEVLTSFLEKSGSSQENYMRIFKGESGIEPKGAVIFYDSNRAFLTVALYDVDKFCQFIEKELSESFVEKGSGVRVCRNIAVKGAQAWMCLTAGKSIDADAIASYASLASSQSFLVTPMGEKLLTEEDDIRGWGVLDTFLNQMLGAKNRSMVNLGMGFLFEGAESVEFSLDFDKGEVEAELTVLNEKGKPAKYQLPADKINVSTLQSIGGSCDAMMAFTLTPKLIKKFDQVGQAFGGALFGNLSEMFKNVDGTVGIVSSGTRYDQAFSGVVTTKGEVSNDFKNMVSNFAGNISEDGKFLRFSKGNVSGDLSAEECAEELKGCCMGIIYGTSNDAFGDVVPDTKGFKWFLMKLKPESGGIEFKIEAKTVDPKENALICILKNMQ